MPSPRRARSVGLRPRRANDSAADEAAVRTRHVDDRRGGQLAGSETSDGPHASRSGAQSRSRQWAGPPIVTARLHRLQAAVGAGRRLRVAGRGGRRGCVVLARVRFRRGAPRLDAGALDGCERAILGPRVDDAAEPGAPAEIHRRAQRRALSKVGGRLDEVSQPARAGEGRAGRRHHARHVAAWRAGGARYQRQARLAGGVGRRLGAEARHVGLPGGGVDCRREDDPRPGDVDRLARRIDAANAHAEITRRGQRRPGQLAEGDVENVGQRRDLAQELERRRHGAGLGLEAKAVEAALGRVHDEAAGLQIDGSNAGFAAAFTKAAHAQRGTVQNSHTTPVTWMRAASGVSGSAIVLLRRTRTVVTSGG